MGEDRISNREKVFVVMWKEKIYRESVPTTPTSLRL